MFVSYIWLEERLSDLIDSVLVRKTNLEANGTRLNSELCYRVSQNCSANFLSISKLFEYCAAWIFVPEQILLEICQLCASRCSNYRAVLRHIVRYHGNSPL